MAYVTIAGKRYKIDAFTKGYFDAALWSSSVGPGFVYDDEEQPEDTAMDEFFEVDDFGAASFKSAVKDCAAFQRSERDDLDASGLADAEAGQLFWLNRNGHGVGFWDRPGGEIGDRLSKAAHVYGSVDLYVGDDGKVHGG